MSIRNNYKEGFTLIELSIVIIIIGFLIAGISAGSNLIKQAKLRSVITDFNTYTIAFNNFVLKYNKLPGDMDNAFALWNTKCAASAPICNGNNDGIIAYYPSDPTASEINKALKHLQLAGMINANIVPVTASIATIVGINAPSSNISPGAGYAYGSGGYFNGVQITLSTAAPNDTLLNAAIAPDDAFAIDQKIDDGGINASGDFTGAYSGNLKSADGYSSVTGSCSASATGYYNMSDLGAINCRILLAINDSK